MCAPVPRPAGGGAVYPQEHDSHRCERQQYDDDAADAVDVLRVHGITSFPLDCGFDFIACICCDIHYSACGGRIQSLAVMITRARAGQGNTVRITWTCV